MTKINELTIDGVKTSSFKEVRLIGFVIELARI